MFSRIGLKSILSLCVALVLAGQAAAQRVFVAEGSTDTIQIYDPATGEFQGDFGGGFISGIQGIALDQNYVYASDSNGIQQFDKDGNYINSFGGGGLLPNPSSIAVSGGSLFAASYDGSVSVFDTATGNLTDTFGSGILKFATGIAVQGQDLFVGDGNQIDEFNLVDDSLVGTIGGGILQSVTGMTFAPDGNLYVTDNSLQGILSFNANINDPNYGTNLDSFAAGFLINPTGIAADSNGLLNVTDAGQQCVFQFGLDGTYFGLYGDGLVNSPVDIAAEHAAAVPEPTGLLALSAFSVFVLARRNRR